MLKEVKLLLHSGDDTMEAYAVLVDMMFIENIVLPQVVQQLNLMARLESPLQTIDQRVKQLDGSTMFLSRTFGGKPFDRIIHWSD